MRAIAGYRGSIAGISELSEAVGRKEKYFLKNENGFAYPEAERAGSGSLE